MASAKEIQAALILFSRPHAILKAEKFFQAFPGGYGEGVLKDLFGLADKLYMTPEVILQKAVGWMLKEAAEIDSQRVIVFVDYRPEPKLIRRIALEKLCI